MLVKIETTKVGESKIQCKDLGSVQKDFRLVPYTVHKHKEDIEMVTKCRSHLYKLVPHFSLLQDGVLLCIICRRMMRISLSLVTYKVT